MHWDNGEEAWKTAFSQQRHSKFIRLFQVEIVMCGIAKGIKPHNK